MSKLPRKKENKLGVGRDLVVSHLITNVFTFPNYLDVTEYTSYLINYTVTWLVRNDTGAHIIPCGDTESTERC